MTGFGREVWHIAAPRPLWEYLLQKEVETNLAKRIKTPTPFEAAALLAAELGLSQA